MRLIRMLLLAALACSPVFAHADDEAAVKRLTGLLDRAQTLSGRFSQLTLDASGLLVQAIGQFVRVSQRTLREAECA